jgi:hypothetical protein
MVHANKPIDEMDFLWECRPVDTDRLNGGDLARIEMNLHAVLCALSMIDRSKLSPTMLAIYCDAKANCVQATRICRKARSRAVEMETIADLYKSIRTLSVYLFGHVRPTIVPVLESKL